MTERTPLRAATSTQYDPQYVFNTGRVYRNRMRQFQCCVCAALLACFVVAIVATVAYSVDTDKEDAGNSSKPDNLADNVLVFLPILQYPLPEQESTSWYGQPPSAAQLEEALSVGHAGLLDCDKLETAKLHMDESSPSYRHQMAVRTSLEAKKLARAGYVLDLAAKHLAESGLGRQKGSREPMGRGPMVEVEWMPPEACADTATFPCPTTPFRSADGSCNNQLHPFKWGVALRPFRRTLPPDYADGVMAPRQALDGGALPSAREVSITVHRPVYRDDPKFTVMLAVWGQFIDHDITATALSTGSNGSAISCCMASLHHPECFPVQLSVADPYYHEFNVTCMEFVRSAPAPTCSLGPREQLNQASAYLDGSVIYGPNVNLTSQLRTMSGGQLRMSLTPDGRTLLPYSVDPSDGCNQKEETAQGRYCFASGDARANENLHLTTMHLLWARQHNLVADWLSEINPSWDDERVFQEARRIVVAQLQHITYSEFLPVLLGDELMSHLDLNPQPSGYFHGYNASLDASIANSFAAAAFRFGHTLLPGLMKMLGNSTEEYVELHRMLFNPYSLYTPGHLDNVLRGALDTHVETVDPSFTKELTEHLFEQGAPHAAPHGPMCGLDLVSLNIQRGRDHGLPAYTAWRGRCGLSRPGNFSDLRAFIYSDSLQKMTELYRSVDDIDLYTGALAERPLEGTFLGPTITCLLTDQFVRLKRGDRFWYETPEMPQAFTLAQLAELRKTSLAQIICDNADSVQKAQPLVMRTAGTGNERVPCSSIPRPDLSLWREEGLGHLKFSLLTTGVHAPSIRMGAHVTSGHIVSEAGSVLWNGRTPLLLLGDSSIRPLWSGILTANSLHGNFSLQFSSQQWLNGQFFLQIFVERFQSDPWEVSGTFISPVYFKDVEQFEVPASHPSSVELPMKFSSTPSVQTTSKLPIMPVVLEGAHSGNRTVFRWSGAITLTIPSSSQNLV